MQAFKLLGYIEDHWLPALERVGQATAAERTQLRLYCDEVRTHLVVFVLASLLYLPMRIDARHIAVRMRIAIGTCTWLYISAGMPAAIMSRDRKPVHHCSAWAFTCFCYVLRVVILLMYYVVMATGVSGCAGGQRTGGFGGRRGGLRRAGEKPRRRREAWVQGKLQSAVTCASDKFAAAT